MNMEKPKASRIGGWKAALGALGLVAATAADTGVGSRTAEQTAVERPEQFMERGTIAGVYEEYEPRYYADGQQPTEVKEPNIQRIMLSIRMGNELHSFVISLEEQQQRQYGAGQFVDVLYSPIPAENGDRITITTVAPVGDLT